MQNTFFILMVGLLLNACGNSDSQGSANSSGHAAAGSASGALSAAATQEATQIFATRCTPCHGPQGKGDGAISANLTPRPRNFTDSAWQGTVTDDHIEKIIQYGGAAVGKSPAMPANPDLQAKPEVVRALAQHIRSFGR